MTEQKTADYSKISTDNIDNLELVCLDLEEKLSKPDAVVLDILSPIIRSFSSHKPSKRAGHAVIAKVLLRKYRDRIPEKDALNYLQNFDFSKKTRKSAMRTFTLAKVTAYQVFISAEILTSNDAVAQALVECTTIAHQKPQLLPYIASCLVQMTIDSRFRFFEETVSAINCCLDGLIFWFKIRNYVPQDKIDLVPEEFRKSMYSIESSEYITKILHLTRQPWNSYLWKCILLEGSDDDLLTFWQSIVMKEIRSGDEKVKIQTLHIVKSVLPILRPSLYPIVICSSFINLLNQFIGISKLYHHVVDFLDFVVRESKTAQQIEDVMKSFAFINSNLPAGFNFHLQMYGKCTIEQLKAQFEALITDDPNEVIEFRQRVRTEKGDPAVNCRNFKNDKIRALFIATAQHTDKEFTLRVFDYLFEKCEKQRSKLEKDLVQYDETRTEGSATLPDILKKPDVSHFDACYFLYAMCTGSSSSPSLDTIIPPTINDATPSSGLILLTMQHRNEPPLIQHAYKVHLKSVSGSITTEQLEEFLKDYVPAEDTFTEDSVGIIKVAVEGCDISFAILAPLFQLFCRTVTNCNDNVARPLSNLIMATLKRETKDFSLNFVLKSIFTSMNELPNRIVIQHEKRIQPVFSAILGAAIKRKLPLTPQRMKAITQQLDEAVVDFAFKSNPHFCVTIFTEFIKLPGNAPHCLFAPILKHLPNAKRLKSRVELIHMVTAITANLKDLDVLIKNYHREFNGCMNALLDEVKNGGTSNDDKKRQEKVLKGIKAWLSNIEKKRNACAEIEIGDLRRRFTLISQMSDPIGSDGANLLKQLQHIEQQVHVKRRNYA